MTTLDCVEIGRCQTVFHHRRAPDHSHLKQQTTMATTEFATGLVFSEKTAPTASSSYPHASEPTQLISGYARLACLTRETEGRGTSLASSARKTDGDLSEPCRTVRRRRVSRILYVRDGGGYREAAPGEVLGRARVLVSRRFRPGAPVLSKADGVRESLRIRLGSLEHEVFAMILLDHRNRLIEYVELFRGTIGGTSVHPRGVVKEALARNASAVIVVHNHPSGSVTQSLADELTTRELKAALELVDIRLLDHLVVGESILSFAERGLL